jgi:nucleoside-diphosphate-sugar epimerase
VHILLAGYGFIGSALAGMLGAAGHRITVLRRKAGQSSGIECVSCDLRHEYPWNIRRHFDAVVFSLAPDERSDAAYSATYCSAQENLQAVITAEHYVYVSSTAVYPDAAGTWHEEDATAHSERARILLSAEAIAMRMPNAAILRFAGLYNRERRIYYGPPAEPLQDRLVHFLHRDDAVRALEHTLKLRLSGVFNVHDGNPQWRSELLRQMGFSAVLLPSTAERRISAAKFFATGFKPQYADFRSGLEF